MPANLPIRMPARRPRVDSGFVAHPDFAGFLRRHGVTSAEAALALRGEIVSGHPERHVARVELGGRVIYLKREHKVGLRVRVRNWRAGYGFVSRSEREAITLSRLAAAGLPGPRWLAYGESAGRAFVLVAELPGRELRDALLSDNPLSLAARVGAAVGELHAAGFSTPDLAAKHVFVDDNTVRLIDWQNAPTPGLVTEADRVRQLGVLHATVADHLADRRTRVRFLRAYAAASGIVRTPNFTRRILDTAARIADKSSIRDQRQPPTGTPVPRLVWLAGEAVCVIPELVADWPSPADGPPFYPALGEPAPAYGKLTLPGGRRAVLVRFATIDPLGRCVAAIRERSWRSPGTKVSRVLFHLTRHGIPAPAILAFGQRFTSPIRAESFVLYEPIFGVEPIAETMVDNMAGEMETMIERLHTAGCRPDGLGAFGVVAGKIVVRDPLQIRLSKRLAANDRRADRRTVLGALS